MNTPNKESSPPRTSLSESEELLNIVRTHIADTAVRERAEQLVTAAFSRKPASLSTPSPGDLQKKFSDDAVKLGSLGFSEPNMLPPVKRADLGVIPAR